MPFTPFTAKGDAEDKKEKPEAGKPDAEDKKEKPEEAKRAKLKEIHKALKDRKAKK